MCMRPLLHGMCVCVCVCVAGCAANAKALRTTRRLLKGLRSANDAHSFRNLSKAYLGFKCKIMRDSNSPGLAPPSSCLQSDSTSPASSLFVLALCPLALFPSLLIFCYLFLSLPIFLPLFLLLSLSISSHLSLSLSLSRT